LNAVGSNRANEREIDSKAVANSNLIVTDSIQQAKAESGDLILAASDGVTVWERVKELADLVTGRLSGRRSDEERTMFKSNGLALEDVAVAYHVYQEALRLGAGVELAI
jgi:ornithine cyclodeaminase/alanine dehydrogenase-like protein (mu-crystallin family)